MREVISVHVGQAGVQIGNACCKFSFLSVVLEAQRFDVAASSTRNSRVRSRGYHLAMFESVADDRTMLQGSFTPLSTV